jgi:hypothetical protein
LAEHKTKQGLADKNLHIVSSFFLNYDAKWRKYNDTSTAAQRKYRSLDGTKAAIKAKEKVFESYFLIFERKKERKHRMGHGA